LNKKIKKSDKEASEYLEKVVNMRKERKESALNDK